jgi:hypothetical protein
MDDKKEKTSGSEVLLVIREFFSEFLGAFLPGVYFMIVMLMIFALSILAIFKSLPFDDFRVDKLDSDSNSGVMMLFVFIFCVISYIIGMVFSNKDPNEPDTASVKKNKLNGKDSSAIKQELDLLRKKHVHYPYQFLKQYFEHRGLNHLAGRIPWDAA